jgi:hypothetical protein
MTDLNTAYNLSNMNTINRFYTNNTAKNIINNQKNVYLLSDHGLVIQNVSWEDTARTKGSCWGPNISDMTLVQNNERYPMIRKPNMSDRTMDIPIEKFKLPVGNEKGQTLKMISLTDYLSNITDFVEYDKKKLGSLFLERDQVILTQTQCCVLDCKEKETIEFYPNIYNYGTSDNNPKVLTITISSKGTSTKLLGNSERNKLYFNDNGTAKTFTASRVADEREKKIGKPQEAVNSFKELTEDEKLENCLIVLQVPLKPQFKEKLRSFSDEDDSGDDNFSKLESVSFKKSAKRSRGTARGFDMAKVGTGSSNGKYIFSVNDKLKLERDERYPIRCTYQYYRVSDNNEMSQELIDNIAEELKSIEKYATDKGSLVYETTERMTEPKLEQKEIKVSDVWNVSNGMI